MPDERPSRRAAVVCRHPATLRPVTQALGTVGIGLRQVVSPALLPRSQRGEFEVMLVDLDIDPTVAPFDLVQAVASHCPGTPILCIAGVNPKARLVDSLRHPAVAGLFPKLGSWVDTAQAQPGGLVHDPRSGLVHDPRSGLVHDPRSGLVHDPRSGLVHDPRSGLVHDPRSGLVHEGPDEQELAMALRRLSAQTPIPHGPSPYLIGTTPIEERLIAGSAEKDEALQSVVALGQRLALSDEKLRRIEVAADELLMNAMFDAPRDAQGKPRFAGLSREERTAPLTLSAKEQVRLRFGCDARSMAISVHDKFGALSREAVTSHVLRVLEAGGPRPRPRGSSASGGAGLGLVLVFGAANQIAVQAIPGKFTEVTAVIHIAGSNRSALARGSSLQLFVT